jgi:ATP-dependent exoDNAse (exonuclease V) beta subunit
MLPRFHTRRFQRSGRRFYSCDGHELPSVTTVISATEDSSWLVAWRERIGHAEADRICAEASALGTRTHFLVENYLLERFDHKQLSLLSPAEEEASDSGPEDQDLLQAFRPFLDQVEELLLTEGTVWWVDEHGKGFAGSFDALVRWRGQLLVIDWKTTRKQKYRGDWGKAATQMAAYSRAIQQRYGIPVNRAVVVSVSRGRLKLDTHVFEPDELDLYWEAFKDRLEAYQQGLVIA